MNKKMLHKLAALGLSLSLALAPMASAMTVEEARDLLRENYIDPISEEVLILPTIKEITDALGDPYTYYMSPEEYQTFQSDLNDTAVVGIGVMVEKMADGLNVMTVAPGSPAEGAGLQPNDLIIAVGSVTMEEAGSPDALAALIAGELGTKVTITVRRDGKTFDATMERAEVVFPVVTGEVVDGHIGWLDVASFGQNTGDYFETYITEEDEEADRWVIDLRGNPGGYATAAIATVGHVLGNHDVAYIVNNQGQVFPWRPNPFPVSIPGLINEPLIVITDGNSASASELFAAAMRDYGYGLVIGTRTFGKGIAQNVFEQEDGSAMKITTDRYYSPEWVTPDRSGVLPNLVVDPNLADGVARLLSGKAAQRPSNDVLVIEMLYEKRTEDDAEDAPARPQKWYVHRDEATSETYAPAFAELLAAIPPNTPMTLNGKAVTPAEVAQAWKTEYASRYFEDVADSPYADEINTLAALGVVQGDEHGNFDPKGELTRAELVALFTQAMGHWSWSSQGRAPFPDVAEESWYSTAVDIMYHLGLVEGDEAGNFNPDALIDHQQFLTILVRSGAWVDFTVRERMEKVTDEQLARSEVQKFDAWARNAAVVAEELENPGVDLDHGILTTSLADMDPTAVTTREEAAAMIYRLMAYSGILTEPNG